MSKDVAIIGASSAGLYTAYLLAQQGLKVRVFEAKESINHSPRTLIVTGHMKALTGSLCESTVVNKIRRFELFTDGRVATIPLRNPDLVIERSRLIQMLAAKAEESGAEIFTGYRFSNLQPNGKRLTFSLTSNGDENLVEETGDVLVGADGTFSKVAKKGGWPRQPTVPLIQAVVELPKDMVPDTTRVWFLPEETPYFFWLIPHSATHGVLGLIAEEEKQGRISLERFLLKKSLVPIDLQSARTPLYTRWIPTHRKLGESDVYLVGDAAGHVKVTTVGGIVTGLRGALGVAEAISNGGSSAELQALRKELGVHRLIRKSLHGFTQADYSRLLDILNPSARSLLSRFTRDEAFKLLSNLLLRQPRLLFLGIRALLMKGVQKLKEVQGVQRGV
jgi:flavin-dependent dehydrogenase